MFVNIVAKQIKLGPVVEETKKINDYFKSIKGSRKVKLSAKSSLGCPNTTKPDQRGGFMTLSDHNEHPNVNDLPCTSDQKIMNEQIPDSLFLESDDSLPDISSSQVENVDSQFLSQHRSQFCEYESELSKDTSKSLIPFDEYLRTKARSTAASFSVFNLSSENDDSLLISSDDSMVLLPNRTIADNCAGAVSIVDDSVIILSSENSSISSPASKPLVERLAEKLKTSNNNLCGNYDEGNSAQNSAQKNFRESETLSQTCSLLHENSKISSTEENHQQLKIAGIGKMFSVTEGIDKQTMSKAKGNKKHVTNNQNITQFFKKIRDEDAKHCHNNKYEQNTHNEDNVSESEPYQSSVNDSVIVIE